MKTIELMANPLFNSISLYMLLLFHSYICYLPTIEKKYLKRYKQFVIETENKHESAAHHRRRRRGLKVDNK
jgi:hypothetical protein